MPEARDYAGRIISEGMEVIYYDDTVGSLLPATVTRVGEKQLVLRRKDDRLVLMEGQPSGTSSNSTIRYLKIATTVERTTIVRRTRP